MRERTRTSLAKRVTIYIVLAISVVLAIVGIGVRSYVYDVSLERGQDVLRESANLLVPHVNLKLGILERDLAILVETPPVSGLIRTADNDGSDPLDGSTDALWRDRLADIFTAILHGRPAYTQIRYIGFADGGLELVRVNQRSGSVEVVATQQLQAKGDRDYARVAASLRAGEVAYSDVDRNIEHGQVIADDPWTIRAYATVFDQRGEPFGFVVINADFVEISRLILADVPAQLRATLMTPAGAVYSRSGGEETFAPPGESVAELQPLLSGVAQDRQAPEFFFANVAGENLTTHQLAATFGRAPHQRRMQVAVSRPTAQILAPAHALERGVLAISVAIVLLAAVVSCYFSGRLTAPLRRLDSMIRAFGDSFDDAPDAQSSLLQRSDEIGDIARSFGSMAARLRVSTAAERAVSALVEQSVDSLVTIDGEGRILSVNPAAEGEFGYSAEELIGENVSLLMPESMRSQHDAFIHSYRENGIAKVIGSVREVEAVRRDGSKMVVELAISEVCISDEEVIYSGLMRNVTQRREAERALAQYAAQLDEANRHLTELNERLDAANEDLRAFAYIVSHDLRAPLVNLTGFSAVLRKSMDSLLGQLRASTNSELWSDIAVHVDERIPKALDYIERSAGQMQQHLDAVLEVSRLGHYETQFDRIEFEPLIEEIMNTLVGERWREVAQIDTHNVPPVLTDNKAVRIILMNLCSNAVKYSDERRALQIDIDISLDEHALRMRVTDNGRGMSEDDMRTMYQLFRRCGRVDTDGQGIGLTFVKTLVDRLGGHIHCDSEPGVGTMFEVEISRDYCRVADEAA